MSNEAYPERPPFFAHRFIRLMGKVCLGAEVGPETCWLLSFIAHTEDAAHYSRAVAFFNVDLATRCGMSLSAMKRARERAVEAGWLHYQPGQKRRPAKYFVMIPNNCANIPDGAGDEGEDSERFPVQSEPQSEPRTGQEADRMRATINPIPFPIPIPPSAGDEAKPSAEKKQCTKAKKPSGTHQEAIAFFCDSWQAKYGSKYAFSQGKDAKHVAEILAHLEGNLERFREVVTRYLGSADSFHVNARHELGLLRSQLNRFTTELPKPKLTPENCHPPPGTIYPPMDFPTPAPRNVK